MADLIGLEIVGHEAAMEAAKQSNPVIPLQALQAMTQGIARREAAELEGWFKETEPSDTER